MVRVLCADDNRDLADTTGELLRRAGYEVRVCYDGADALAAAEEFDPDVCVLDLNMPEVPGERVAVLVRARDQGRRGLIALTGYGRRQDFRRTELAGFDAHLLKPVAPADLLATIRWVAGPAPSVTSDGTSSAVALSSPSSPSGCETTT
jgi:CheY-like chemotaxis protein